MRRFRDQKGIALVTALFFLIIVTALASGAIMLATVQQKVSGSVSWWETTYAGAEGGINYVIPLMRDIYHRDPIPAVYLSDITDPNLEAELQDPLRWNDPDTLSGSPDIRKQFGNITVAIDIDMTGTVKVAGFDITPSMLYHKGNAPTANVSTYRVTTQASTPDNGVRTCLEQIIYIK